MIMQQIESINIRYTYISCLNNISDVAGFVFETRLRRTVYIHQHELRRITTT